MLSINDIKIIRINKDKYKLHLKMPPPPHSQKELTTQISAIGDTILGELLNITPELFEMQLEAARKFGVSFLTEDDKRGIVGISAATSVIKSGDVLRKNLILPKDMLRRDTGLSAHYILAMFMQGGMQDGVIREDSISDISVAGWIDSRDARDLQVQTLPSTFSSKLSVVAVPCSKLRPVDELMVKLNIIDTRV